MTNRMLDDERMDQVVHGWMHEDDGPAPDRADQVGSIMEHVDATKQWRRWWPLIPFGRRAVHSAGDTDGSPHTAGRPGRLAPVSALATIAILVIGGSLLLYSASVSPPPLAPGAAIGSPMPPEDRALFEQFGEVWADKTVDSAGVLEVFAPDATHTALWTDITERISGADEIAARIRTSKPIQPDDRTRLRLPDAWSGERRYLDVKPEIAGMPCVYWIAEDRITRLDCILPYADSGAPFASGDPPTDVTSDELAALNLEAWAGDRDTFDQVISPDIIHVVAFNDETVVVEGVDAYWRTARRGEIQKLAPNIDLPAPEGELRWTDYSSVGGGSLCTFWAKDGQIIRHDCIVPTISQ